MARTKPLVLVLLGFMTFGIGACARMPLGARNEGLLDTGVVGWQQIGGRQGSWRFEEGILYTDGGGGGWLSTVRQYSDFELSLEFRVPPQGNSGIFLRAPHEGDPAYTGMEIQVLDDYSAAWGNLRPNQYTGSIYGVQAPSERVTRPAGQWQNMRVVCCGSKVKVVLNGEKIIDTDVTYYPYKYDTHPGLARSSGYIGLQNHGSRVEYRNVRIRELPEARS